MPRGRVIAFGGRILGDGEPKYLNSPDTPLFDKGRTLYNIDRAGPASRTARRLIVVEGYMDVIGLDRAGISEVVAPNGTAVTEAQLERMWRLDPRADPVLRRRQRRPQGRGPRRAPRPAPHRPRPHAALRRAARRPGPRRCRSCRRPRCVRGPARPARAARPSGCGGTSATPPRWRRPRPAPAFASASSSTARRSPIRRCAASTATSGSTGSTREIAPKRAPARSTATVPSVPDPASCPPIPPVGDQARAIGAGGIDRATARALIAGFINFPEALPSHCEQLAALPIPDARTARLRDHLVNAAFSQAALDRDGLATILESAGAGADLTAVRGAGGIGYSFTRSDAEPATAVRDLGVAIEALSADGEIGAALAEATERLMAGEDQAFEEQQRLHVAREKVKERLASLSGTD